MLNVLASHSRPTRRDSTSFPVVFVPRAAQCGVKARIVALFALTPAGLKEAFRLAAGGAASVGCGADAISEAECRALTVRNVSRFIYPLGGEPPDVLAGASETIEEHHPNEIVWVENVRNP